MKELKRRGGRDLALKLLFQADVGEITIEDAIFALKQVSESSQNVWNFAEQLARGAWEERESSDAIIAHYAKGWAVERIPNVDRAILRIAIYEMTSAEVDYKVSINEAVELAKEYSTIDSSRFINGILGTFLREELK